MKKFSKYYHLASIIFYVFIFNSCVIETFDDPGKYISFNYTTSDFNKVEIKNIFDIVLIQDSGNYIAFECYENQKNKISVENQNGLLTLKQSIEPSMLGNYKHIKAYIHYKNINNINLENCVKLENSGTMQQSSLEIYDGSELSEVNLMVNLENLTVSNNSENLSYYTFTGKSTNVAFYLQGSSIMKASGLESDYCNVEQGSICDCYVFVLKKLSVKFLGKGNVYLKGNAEINVDSNRYQKVVHIISGK
jgi:hypothetical protein